MNKVKRIQIETANNIYIPHKYRAITTINSFDFPDCPINVTRYTHSWLHKSVTHVTVLCDGLI